MKIKKAMQIYREHSYNNKALKTYLYEENLIKAISRAIDELKIRRINQLNNSTLNQMIAIFKRTCKNITINKRLKYLRQVLQYVGKYKIKIKLLRETKTTFDVFSEDEIISILEYIDSLPNDNYNIMRKMIIHLLYDSGVRGSELLNIERKNVDIEKSLILLTSTKTKEERYIVFRAFSKKWIEKVLAIPTDSKYLLYNFQTKSRFNYKHLRGLMNNIKLGTGIKKVHPHMFRHTLGTVLAEHNLHITKIQKILGHHNLATTQRYIHMTIKKAQKDYNMVMKNKEE